MFWWYNSWFIKYDWADRWRPQWRLFITELALIKASRASINITERGGEGGRKVGAFCRQCIVKWVSLRWLQLKNSTHPIRRTAPMFSLLSSILANQYQLCWSLKVKKNISTLNIVRGTMDPEHWPCNLIYLCIMYLDNIVKLWNIKVYLGRSSSTKTHLT